MTPGSALSYSSSRTYLECPLRWKFLYIDRLPETPHGYFTFGRTIHSVLEELVRPLISPVARRAGDGELQRTLDDWRAAPEAAARALPMDLETLMATYDRLWSGEGYSSTEEEKRYRELGAEMVAGFYRQMTDAPPQPVSVEEHLEANWDGIPVHGYLDRIDRTPTGGLEIVDYKTSREIRLQEARESDQLALYQVLVERNYADPVVGLTLYHLRTLTPIRTLPRPRRTLDGLYERLGSVADGIRAEAYEPTPGRHCTRCEFQPICPEFRRVSPGDEARLKELVDRFHGLRAQESRLAGELEHAATDLHRAAEQAGVYRVPGTASVAIRRKEETWSYPPDRVRSILAGGNVAGERRVERPEEVRRLIRDPTVDPEVRRQVAATGTRRVKWYWDLEEEARAG